MKQSSLHADTKLGGDMTIPHARSICNIHEGHLAERRSCIILAADSSTALDADGIVTSVARVNQTLQLPGRSSEALVFNC